MKKIPSFLHHKHDVDAIAAAWLAKRDAGMDPEEHQAFEAWRKADRRHVAAVERLEASWRLLAQLREFRPEASRHPDRDLLIKKDRRMHTLLPVWGVAFAALILGAILVWKLPYPPSQPLKETPLTYSTGTGGFQHIVLEDGSAIDLNANTKVQVRYSIGERGISLQTGEATFSVAKNPTRPFTVSAGNVVVRAIGTAFNVRIEQAAVEVLVTEGRVKVERKDAKGPSKQIVVPSVGAGEKLLIQSASPVTEPPKPTMLAPDEVRGQLAWHGPRLRFVETPLADVVAEFNRYNKVRLELGDSEVGQLRVDGSFIAENAEAFVRLMELNGNLEIERREDGCITLRKRH